MSDDNERADAWRDTAQEIGADNHRMCNIIEAADKLADAVDDYLMRNTYSSLAMARKALINYQAARKGN